MPPLLTPQHNTPALKHPGQQVPIDNGEQLDNSEEADLVRGYLNDIKIYITLGITAPLIAVALIPKILKAITGK